MFTNFENVSQYRTIFNTSEVLFKTFLTIFLISAFCPRQAKKFFAYIWIHSDLGRLRIS